MQDRRREILDQIEAVSRDRSTRYEGALATLKRRYNQLVINARNERSSVRCDIIDVFPPEVWIQIISNSLPAYGYASALLLLTMVSNKWRHALASVPEFWSHIEIRGSAEDALATVETFVHLSRNRPIDLYIYSPLRHTDALPDSIAEKIGHRVREISIRYDSGDDKTGFNYLPSDSQNSMATQYLFSRLAYFPNIYRINLTNSVPVRAGDVSHPWTEEQWCKLRLPHLRAIRGWWFGPGDFKRNPGLTSNLVEFGSLHPLEKVLNAESCLPKLKRIQITGWSGLRPSPDGFPSLPNLTSLCYQQYFRNALMRLLEIVAPQLRDLELSIPYQRVPLLQTPLMAARKLHTLALHITEGSDGYDEGDGKLSADPPTIDRDPALRIPGLHNLRLCIDRVPRNLGRRYSAAHHLLAIFAALYPHVERAEFDIIQRELDENASELLSYLSLLPKLRFLHVNSRGDDFSFDGCIPIDLDSLETLDCGNTDLLRCVRPPNLLALQMIWNTYCKGADTLVSMAALAKVNPDMLHITAFRFGMYDIEFPHDGFPYLASFAISFMYDGRFGAKLKLATFPFLSTITIHRHYNYATYATPLCYALLCSPEDCPSLSHVAFDGYPPNWDVLFVMLERRNFLKNGGISRIRSLTLPFIADELRAPLASLLCGVYTRRPSDDELLLGDGDGELMLDTKAPGCYTCIGNLMGPCKEPVKNAQEYPSYPDSTRLLRDRLWQDVKYDGASSTVYDWNDRRKKLLKAFLAKFSVWTGVHAREITCSRIQCMVQAVEITENDMHTKGNLISAE